MLQSKWIDISKYNILQTTEVTVIISSGSPADVQAHLVEGAEIFRQRFVAFLVKTCQCTELLPLELGGLPVTLDTECRDDAVEVGFFTARPMTVGR